MTDTLQGDYFTTKEEAVSFYKSNFKNLEDKPDWMVEAMIDFCIRYPCYNEYIEVERKAKNNIPLSDYETSQYGSLDWDKRLRTYKRNEIIDDMVDIKDQGQYDDLVHDSCAREKLNKYGLDFGQSLEPSDHVTIKLTNKNETVVFKAPVHDLNQGIHSTGTFEKE